MHLCLLGSFSVHHGDEPIDLSAASQRVLAVLDLLGGASERSRLAGTLWPESSGARADANLRGAIWRMPTSVSRALVRSASMLAFDRSWTSDVARCRAHAKRVRDGDDPGGIDADLFAQDLLPAWDETWLDLPRERHRQLRLHALELLATRQLEQGDGLNAVDTVMEAVLAEPLRESAQLVLVRAHLAAGNRMAALQAYDRFRDVLRRDLGVEPGAEMEATLSFARADHQSVTRG